MTHRQSGPGHLARKHTSHRPAGPNSRARRRPGDATLPDRQDLGLLGAGRLIVANPLLPDPNFDRTVVMLLAHGEEGALGVVLNRPSETMLAAPLPRWERLAAS